jgi:hypothetical protein
MLAYLVLLTALLSRLLPPLFHLTAMNFTAVGGSLLFFGARRPRWQSGVAVAALMVADFLLTAYAYHYAFHVRDYLMTWAWYAGVCLAGHALLQRVTVPRVALGAAGSATSFFVLSNLMVWMGHMYPHTLAGLGACYFAALPFYRNDLISTGIVAGVLFGVPVLVSRMALQERKEASLAG